ncbi:MAG: hypothetical protein OEY56_04405, partial [Cyclobacteriaceae bacterium]|nr:hypothetical protein [Cyclobacteriaceae bacterium]
MKKIIFISFVAGLLAACDTFKADVNPESGTISQGGSLARFTIVGDYLYIVNDRQLIPVNIRDLAAPQKNAPVDLDIGVETIFPYQGNLFIGSASAVYIYSLGNPAAPARLSVYQHATGCDPVVVKDNYAYVTLREGVSCLNTFQMNVLEVLDISNLRAPNMVATVDMRSPRGLGIGCN